MLLYVALQWKHNYWRKGLFGRHMNNHGSNWWSYKWRKSSTWNFDATTSGSVQVWKVGIWVRTFLWKWSTTRQGSFYFCFSAILHWTKVSEPDPYPKRIPERWSLWSSSDPSAQRKSWGSQLAVKRNMCRPCRQCRLADAIIPVSKDFWS